MIELPEAVVIARQITETLGGKRIAYALANASPHKFAWYTGDPSEYNSRLAGKVIGKGPAWAGASSSRPATCSSRSARRFAIISRVRRARPSTSSCWNSRTARRSAPAPRCGAAFSVTRSGARRFSGGCHRRLRPSPLTDAFDRPYFDTLFNEETPKLSAKAFLATEQRIPGLGNGVLQDILWAAHIHRRKKMGELTGPEVGGMFQSVKRLLAEMTAQGGRDTERDLFGRPGGYKTVLSKNTVGSPCPVCGRRSARSRTWVGDLLLRRVPEG